MFRFLIWLILPFMLACQPDAAASHGTKSEKHGQRESSAAVASQVDASGLPPEARETLRAIRQGGPYAYDRDGVVFGNYEHALPKQPRGYYHEYTVKTPGAHNRGARRIIAGSPGEYYYSADHYQTFTRIRE